MEFPTNISKFLKVDDQGYITCTGKTLNKQINPNFLNEGTKMINEIINELGANSAKSQGLKQIITTAIKFNGTEHNIYIKIQGNKAIGFLRTGYKKLFYHDNIGNIKQITPTCVLDIYIHENYQRTGIGKQVFQTFLKYENKRPQKLAYDRPSPKLIGFLKKHYGLSKYLAQNNNFVIFDQYFSSSNNQSSLKNLPVSHFQQQPPFTNPLNRFYKYEKKSVIQVEKSHNPSLQNQQRNKTMNYRPSSTSSNRIDQQQAPNFNQITNNDKNFHIISTTKRSNLNSQKIQDSQSLLEKQMNRMPIKTSNKDSLKQQLQKGISTMQNQMNQTKNHKITNYGCPWATEENIVFRTTSGSYGSHYGKYK